MLDVGAAREGRSRPLSDSHLEDRDVSHKMRIAALDKDISMVIRFILFIFSYHPPPSNVTASGQTRLQALIANESALLGIQDTSEPPRSYINAHRQHSSLHCGSSGPGHILNLFLLACSKHTGNPTNA